MKELNNRFDTDKSILDAIFDEIGENELLDHVFDQVIDEFEMDETSVMALMMDSDKYNFDRSKDGWEISIK